MSIEFLSELENKIDALVVTYKRVKDENERLRRELEEITSRTSSIEAENQNMKNELSTLRVDSEGRQEKLNTAAEKIQSLLTKLESVE